MTEYLTEQEQIELLKKWIKQYGFVIIIGIALAILGVAAWRYWQKRQVNILSHASRIYDEMITKRAQDDASATLVQSEKLFSHYQKTIYAEIAAFSLARDSIIKKNYLLAGKHLRWIIAHSHFPAFTQIARLRLARIMITTKNFDAALAILQTVDDKSFLGLIDEIRGDAYLASKNTALARQSYQLALKELPNAEIIRPLLQMKLDNLAQSPSQHIEHTSSTDSLNNMYKQSMS